MRKSTTTTTAAAFTLAELLIVIVILFVLTAVLLPVLLKSKEDGRKASCLSNERQFGLALLAYSQENDTYPAVNDWARRRFLPTVLGCPSLPNAPDIGEGYPGYAYTMAPLSLASRVNRATGRDDDDPAEYRMPTASVKFPANTVAIGETLLGLYMMGSVPVQFSALNTDCKQGCDDKNVRFKDLDTLPGSTRHNGGVNYLFFDGHAKWLVPGQVLPTGGPNDGTVPTLSL